MKLFFLIAALALASALGAVSATDDFGYHLSDVPFSYTDISGSGTPVNPGDWTGTADDGYLQINLPFNFQFYGAPFNKVTLVSNGYLQFGSNSASFSSSCLGANIAPSNIAAAYWMDLNPGLGGAVHWEVLGAPGSRLAVIQFTNVPPNLGPGSLSFQFVLHEGTNDIEMRYLSTSSHDGGASAASGLRSLFDCPNHTALPFSCHTATLGDALALYYNYPSPEPVCGTLTITPTFSVSPTRTPSFTASPSFTRSPTPSATPSATPSFSFSPTSSFSPTLSPSFTVSPSFSASPTETPSLTLSATPSASPSPTATATPSPTETLSPSPTATATVTLSSSPTLSFTLTATPTLSSTLSPSFSASPSFSFSPTATLSATPTSTASPTATLTPSPTATPSFSSSATPTFSHSPTATVSPTPTNSPFPPATKPACVVLGEPGFSATAGLGLAAAGLSMTSGVAVDTGSSPMRLYVSDAAHHRILIWNDAAALVNGGPADGVIGQANFTSGLPNRGGAAAGNSLSSPGGIEVDLSTGDLWVADTGNHRVLSFSKPIPLSGASAGRVLGQAGLFTGAAPNLGGVSAQSLQGPTALSIDSGRHMALADTGNHRVLRFDLNNAGDAATDEWGQSSFNAALPNRGGGPAQDSLLSPSGVLATASELWVADTGNHRVLRFDLTFITPTASLLLGQTSYNAGLSNQGAAGPGPNSLNTPLGLSLDSSQRLYVADSLNHRVLAFAPPYAPNATLVYGQGGFFSGAPGVGNDRMNLPSAIQAGSSGNLFVADGQNHRLLLYGCNGAGPATPTPSATPTATPTATKTATPSATPTSSISATHTPSLTPTPTPSFSFSPTQSATLTISSTLTLSASSTRTSTATLTATPIPSASMTDTPVVAPTLSPYPHPQNAALSYPNPATRASGQACLAFPAGSRVEIRVYDLLLQEVRKLEGAQVSPQRGLACWDLRNGAGQTLAPGIYYVRIVVDGKPYLAKFTLI
jgi:hypothetical protein